MKRPRHSPPNRSEAPLSFSAMGAPEHAHSSDNEVHHVLESSSAWMRTAATMVFRRHAAAPPPRQKSVHTSTDTFAAAATAATSAAAATTSLGRRRPTPLHAVSDSNIISSGDAFSPRPPLSASSSSSSSSSSTTPPTASTILIRTQSSDKSWWRSTVARKRSSPRSNNSSDLTTMIHYHTKNSSSSPQKTKGSNRTLQHTTELTSSTAPMSSGGGTAPSIGAGTLASSSSTSHRRSFRRKRRQRGFCYLLRSRQGFRRILLAISSLFSVSFFAAFCVSHPSLLRREAFQSEAKNKRQTRVKTFVEHQEKTDEESRVVLAGPIKTHLRSSHALSLALSSNKQQELDSGTASNPRSNNVASHVSMLRKTSDLERDNPYKFVRFATSARRCEDPITPQQVDFTVVTQMSLNRLWMMEHHCARWKHAFSIAVYTGGDTSRDKEENHSPPTDSALRDRLVNEMNCTEHQISIQTVAGYSDEEYPVNVLRNVALSAVRTSHVVYVDVDFWESSALYEQLHHHAGALASDPKLALVVPAFAMVRQCADYRDCREMNVPRMPQTRDNLIDLMLDNHQASAFDPSNVGGHGSTRYKEWLRQGDDELLPIECVKSNRYEPYLVVRHCHDLPPFQEAFTGYGKNKMTWMMQLRRTGYHFMQVGGNAFVVHYPHLDSAARLHWNGGVDGKQLSKPKSKDEAVDWTLFKRGQIDETFVAFRTWLARSVPDTSVVPMCEDALNDDERLWTNKEAPGRVE